jgi:DNA polymerase-1
VVAFDTETSGLDPWNSVLVGMSFATAAGRAWWVPATTPHWDLSGLLDAVRPVLTDPAKTWVGHNLKFDIKVCELAGVRMEGTVWDTLLAHYLLQPESAHKLDRVAETELNYRPIPIEDLIGPKGKDQRTMADLDPAAVTDYACEDADVAWRLRERLGPALEEAGAKALFEEVECPLVRVLADMELTGVRLDVEQLAESGEDLAGRVAELTARIHTLADKPFNLDSPKQLSDVLFGHLGIVPLEKPNKTGAYPTGEDVLQKLAGQHPIISDVLRYRKLRKLLSTYIEPLPRMVVPSTGRIHTDYMQAVAATGRLSSTDPNLQNIPIRTEDGRSIRKAFVPTDANHVLLAADYSQVELRIAASLSGDPGLVEAFASGHDIHTATAARVFGVDIVDVDRDMRSKAKAVNFGILYGQGAFGLAGVLGISRKEAKAIIDAYFEQFPTLQAFTQTCVARARECGYAETVLGRRRYLPDLHSNNATVRAFAERNAVNAPIQGSAADIIKVAMVRCARRLQEGAYKTRMILQVHDELVFDVPKNELASIQSLVKETMEQAVELQVPLVVDVSTGDNWLEAHG